MGRYGYGYYVIESDGHGGEPLGWRRRIPDRHVPDQAPLIDRAPSEYFLAGNAARLYDLGFPASRV
jgi:hypothetical protein